MEGLLKVLLFLIINPVTWIIHSCVFLLFIVKKSESVKTVFYLKCYCIFMMPLAIEALIRSMIYMKDIHGILDGYVVSFLIVSIFILCFCVLTLISKFINLITHKICFCFALLLAYATIIFPFVFPSDCFKFWAPYQIISVWGCIAAALYILFRCALYNNESAESEKVRILKIVLRYCVVLAVWVVCILISSIEKHDNEIYPDYIKCKYAINRYNKLYPEAFSELPPTETVDITDRLDISVSNVRVILKNKKYSLQYNARYCFLRYKGLPPLGFGAYFGMSFEDYKKQLAISNENYNSPDLESRYDGIGDVFFQQIVFPIER